MPAACNDMALGAGLARRDLAPSRSVCAVVLWIACLAGPGGVPIGLVGGIGLASLMLLLPRRRAGRVPPPLALAPARLAGWMHCARRQFPGRRLGLLGNGGRWEASHSAALHAAASPEQGLWQGPARQRGARMVWVPDEMLGRNALALGAPGSGKSSLLVVLAWQAQQRGQPVIVIDPKGSRRLQGQLASGARQAGRPFLNLLAGCPIESIRYDPLRQCRDGGEIATRLCSLIPGEGADPFRAFCWGVLAAVADALLALGRPATIAGLRGALGDRGASLVPELCRCGPASDGIRQGLETLLSHDPVHFRKMTAALMPLFELLYAGGLDAGASDAVEHRPLLDVATCRDQGATLYVGLDALGNPTLAQALGRLLLEDLAMDAARRMRTDRVAPELRLMIDEAGEVACEALLQLLGKGREAGVRMLLAVQTLADLEWRLGTVAAARVAEGNAGAWFLFRQLDAGSRRESEARLGPVPLARESRSHGRSAARIRGRQQEGESVAVAATREFLARVPEACFPALRDLECLAQLADGSLWHLRLPLPVVD